MGRRTWTKMALTLIWALIWVGAMLAGAADIVGTALAATGHRAEARETIVVGMHLEPPHLDPTAGAAGAIDEVTYANLFEGLTRIDQEGRVVPGLAERWTISDDGLVYSFYLRHGVHFHDGSPFDATVVRFSLDRARAPDSVNAQKGYFTPIHQIAIPDSHTVVITLSRPDGLFLFNLGSGDAVMVSPASAAGNKHYPIGTGPFRFVRWVTGDRIVLERNPDYYGLRPFLREVTFRFISDPAAQVAGLLAGDIDCFPQFGAHEALPRFAKDPRFRITVGSTEGEALLALNNRRPPFTDLRVRRAISHAIDRQAIIDGALSGRANPIGSHFPPHRDGYLDLTGRYPYDPGKARALLQEAGLAHGFDAVLKLPPPSYARRSGEIIASQLGEVGIRVRIEAIEWAPWLASVLRGADFDMTIIAHTEPLDIDIYARDNYYFGYRSEAFNAIIDQLARTRDESQRATLYGEAQRRIAEDAVNAFLFQLPKISVHNADITGLWINNPIQAIDMTGVVWK